MEKLQIIRGMRRPKNTITEVITKDLEINHLNNIVTKVNSTTLNKIRVSC